MSDLGTMLNHQIRQPITKTDCTTCSNKPICRYVEDAILEKNRLQEVKHMDSVFEIEFRCKHYRNDSIELWEKTRQKKFDFRNDINNG